MEYEKCIGIPASLKTQINEKGDMGTIADDLPDPDELEKMSQINGALSDLNRLKIMLLLNEQHMCVCMIKQIVKIPDSKLSYHLSVLRESGLIKGKRQGNWIIYQPTKLGGEYHICSKMKDRL